MQRLADGDVIQRAVQHDAPAYTDKGGRAGAVRVENIRGSSLDAGANAPSVDVFGWPELKAAGHTLANPGANNSHYNAVRMHLWNGRLGGPGGDARNLAPGPAQTNSSMSAGPETASKGAVDGGLRIWLETEVWYQHSTGNAHDFTSVIPNRMRMQWGYMEKPDGSAASTYLFNNVALNAGAAQPPAWDVTIDQPAGALGVAAQQQYRTLTDGDTVQLDALLAAASIQEKAQAYALVTPALQKHMLLRYPAVYAGMNAASQTAALSGLSGAEVRHLAETTLGLTDARQIHDMILEPLLADQARLEDAFGQFGGQMQGDLLRVGGWTLLKELGATGTALRKASKTVFNIAPKGARYALLDSMSRDEIETLLNGRIDKALFDGWARFKGKSTAWDRWNFINHRVPKAMGKSYWSKQSFDRSREKYDAKKASDNRPRRDVGKYG